MLLERAGSQAFLKGLNERFTGTVRIDPLHNGPEPARVSCANVTFEPGSRSAWPTHWHGATPTSAMTHMAIQEALGGKAVEWMEKVTDEEYLVGPAALTA